MDNTSGSHRRIVRRIIVLRAFFGCLIASGLVAAITIVLDRGFGASDMWLFLLWSLPFAGAVATIALFSMRLSCRLSLFIRYLVAGFFGAISGVLWTYSVALLLGPWFGAFSLPVFACWTAGGASGMLAAAGGYANTKRGRIVVELALVGLLSITVAIGTGPLIAWFSGDQRLELVFVRWKLSPDPLSIEKKYGSGLTSEEMARLESIGLSGQLTVLGPGVFGRGKNSRAVIVMQSQVESSVELAQPDAVEVIYIQIGSEWKMYPPDAPTLKRTILLEPFKHDPRSTSYMVELADGAAQGGTAFSW